LRAERDDVLFPYAILFLADLGDVRDALALPQGPGDEIVETLEHADEPIGAVHVAIPQAERWTVVSRQGPFDKAEALAAAVEAYAQSNHPRELDWWFALVRRGLCDAVREPHFTCPP
jgi:hypothetical protein